MKRASFEEALFCVEIHYHNDGEGKLTFRADVRGCRFTYNKFVHLFFLLFLGQEGIRHLQANTNNGRFMGKLGTFEFAYTHCTI